MIHLVVKAWVILKCLSDVHRYGVNIIVTGRTFTRMDIDAKTYSLPTELEETR